MSHVLKHIILAGAAGGALWFVLWSPPDISRHSFYFYTFLFLFVPLMTGDLVCRTLGPNVSEWTLLGVIVAVFLMWANLGVLIGGSISQSIPVVVSNVAVTNLAATHPTLAAEHEVEFKVVVYQFFADAYRTRSAGKLTTKILAYSPILLGFFVYLFFAYLGFKLARRGELRRAAMTQPRSLDDDV